MSRPAEDKVSGSAGPIHFGSAGPCKNFGFYSKMVSIGGFWTGGWLNLHFNMMALAALHWKGIGAEQKVS